MSLNPVLVELVTYLTSPAPPSPRAVFLRARYHHFNHLHLFHDLLSLIYNGATLNTSQSIDYSRLNQLLKTIFLSADLIFTLLLATKLYHALDRSDWGSFHKQRLPKGLEQVVKVTNNFGVKGNTKAQQAKLEALKLCEWLHQVDYFQLYFHLLNGRDENCKEHINSFLMDIGNNEETPLSQQELSAWSTQVLTQCQKLTKRTNQEEATTCIYIWLRHEVNKAFLDQPQTQTSMLAQQTLSRVVAIEHTLTCLTLIQVLDNAILQAPLQAHRMLSLLDQLILSKNSSQAFHSVFVLAPTIFLQIVNKKVEVSYQSISTHLHLWKSAMQRRSGPFKLLMCLSEWVGLLYDRRPLDKQTFSQTMQLFRHELLKLHKDSRISAMRPMLEEMQMDKIEKIYEGMEPFHSRIQQLEASIVSDKSQSQDKQYQSFQKAQKISFRYNPQQESSREEIRSLMQSLRSSKAQTKSILPQKHQQLLEIYSKRQSLHRQDKNSQISISEDVALIVNTLEVYQFRPSSIASRADHSSERSLSLKGKVDFLPIMSFNSDAGQEMTSSGIEEIDSYGLRDRALIKTKQLKLHFLPLRPQVKRKIFKNRGMVVRNKFVEINYVIDSIYFRRRITLFASFRQPLQRIELSFIENSIKLWKKAQFSLQKPSINKQYQFNLDIQRVKLYQMKDVSDSSRFLKSKLQISLENCQQEHLQQTYELHIYLFNLMEWMEIPEKEVHFFQLEPELTSPWLPLCHKIQKNRQSELSCFFPFLRIDQKGNLCLKLRFLHEIIFAKVFMVLNQLKIVLINSSSEVALMGLLELLSEEVGVR